jgi:hypothetical protein
MVRRCGDAKSREQVRRFGRGANADRNLLPPKHQNCADLTNRANLRRGDTLERIRAHQVQTQPRTWPNS